MQAQSTVKQAKEQYDKLKDDVTEKISMLNASRCSLLSRSLPLYQEAVLEFFENASEELQTVLNDFKSCHHHQYKIMSEEDETSEEPKSPHGCDSEDSEDIAESNQPLLDLSLGDDQAAEAKKQESSTLTADYYVNTSYQAVDTFSQLKTVQMDLEPTNKQATLEWSDSLVSATDDDDDDNMWSKLLLTSSVQTPTDEATTDLNLLKINPSALLMPMVSSTTASCVTAVASSNSSSVLHNLSDCTPSSAKLQDNWDGLFAGLDPLSNEKV